MSAFVDDGRPDSTCLFCRIVSGHIPATIVATDEQTVAFRDINPAAPTHVLVVPRLHVPSAVDAHAFPGLWNAVMTAATRVAAAEGLDETGYRLNINTGVDAGQSVGHLHVHVLGGRAMSWPPG